MVGLVADATALLRAAERRLEAAAQNIANVTTTGYKRVTPFPELLNTSTSAHARRDVGIDFSPGQTIETGAALDFKISGDGFFVVRGPEGWLYTRSASFMRDSAGAIVTKEGFALQTDKGDLQTSGAALKVASDGAIIDGQQPIGRLKIVSFDDLTRLSPAQSGFYAAADGSATEQADIEARQGALEASNVSSATEMLATMEALRGAETGQRLVQVYDELLGKAFTTLGQS
jgi:flagellar basal-body rod protein FlgG